VYVEKKPGYSLWSTDDILLLVSESNTKKSLGDQTFGIAVMLIFDQGIVIEWTAITIWNEANFNGFKQLLMTAI